MTREDRMALKATTACALALAMGGCGTTSVVQSAPVKETASATALGRGRPYLTYFLPQTVFVATVKWKSAGGGEDGKKDGGPSATVNNTITIDGKKVEEDGKGDAPGGDTAVDCKKTLTRLSVLHDAHEIYRGQRGIDIAALRTLSAQLHSEAELAVAQKKLDALKATDDADRARLLEAQKLKVAFEVACKNALAVEVSTVVSPDRDNPFMLILQDDDLSADTVTAKVDANGLLTTVSTTADEKTGETLVGAVKSLGTVFGAVGGVTVPTPAAAAGAAPAYAFAPKGRLTLPERIARFKAELERLAQLPIPSEIALPKKPPPYPLRYTLQDLAAPAKIGDTDFYLKAVCSDRPGELRRDTTIPPRTRSGQGYTDAIEGVAISTPRACQLTAYQGKETPGEHPTWNVVALDSQAPMEAYLLRTQLIRRGSVYGFENGRVTEITSDKPSTTAAAWALPGSLIGGLFSGIVEGIKGPQSVYQTQADYLNAKASVYEAQAALLEAKNAKDDDEDDGSDDDS